MGKTEVLQKVSEGKTKIIFEHPKESSHILVRSKDDITAGDGAKHDLLEGKKLFSTRTTCQVFEFLQRCGFPAHYIRQVDEETFEALSCDMIPLEVVARRIATGSYLRRFPYINEGKRFAPPLVELFLKDDARHDPFMTLEQILSEKVCSRGGRAITEADLSEMEEGCRVIFSVLERAWSHLGVTLVDLKVEFGFSKRGEKILLADVIDNDSWRIWPGGDKGLMKDKQVYRNLKETTPEALKEIASNYRWVAEMIGEFLSPPSCLVVVVMGSSSDRPFAEPLLDALKKFEVETEVHVISAHKASRYLLDRLCRYEGSGKSLVYIAVAGRSNALGPVIDANTAFPVINCPPPSEQFGGMDILSSLRLPSGIACPTILDPGGAALAAMKILGEDSPLLWGRVKVLQWMNEQKIRQHKG